MLRVCRVCNTEKPFEKGSWVVNKGAPQGRVCLACLGKTNLQRYHARAKSVVTDPAVIEANRALYRLKSRKFLATEAGRVSSRLRSRKWAKNNPLKVSAKNARRYLAKRSRVASWADLGKIAEYYALAKYLTTSTGVLHVVDHIIPLQGTTVSGLHVENNLQVITFEENARKGLTY